MPGARSAACLDLQPVGCSVTRSGGTSSQGRRSVSWQQFLVAAGALIAVVFAFLDPEPSRSLPLGARLLYWTLHVGLLLGLMQASQLALSRLLPPSRLGGWVQIAIAGFMAAAAFAPVAIALDRVFGLNDIMDHVGHVWLAAVLDEFSAIAPPAVLTWLGLNGLKGLSLPAPGGFEAGPVEDDGRSARAGPEPSASEPAPAPFLERLPASLGKDLVALSAELHYLRVETAQGAALIHYPFGRAVAELAGRDAGTQIHRSHWVADSHVQLLERDADQMFCVLDSGTRLPVGRRRRAEIVRRFNADPNSPDVG